MYQSINPYTRQLIAEYAFDQPKAIENKLASASAAFGHWKKQGFEQRGRLLQKVADLLTAQNESLAQLASSEMGKPLQQSRSEVEKCAWVCSYYAQNAAALLETEARPIEAAAKTRLVYQPLGTILLIMPWNFPFWQVFRCAAPLLMAGNTVLLKHAPNVGGCALAMERIFREAGAEAGLFQSIFVGVNSVQALLESPVVQGVSLTGSVQAGAAVAALAGKALKKCVLELGGSDAFVVLPDADLEKAAQTAVLSRLQNNGQTCIAAKRFIVLPEIADAFTEHLLTEIKKWKVGDPMAAETRISTMARPDLVESLQAQVRQSIDLGAKVLLDGGQQGDSNFFLPMLLSNIQPNMVAYHQELFGPVFSLFVADNESQALHLANDTAFGLGASIWSQDEEKAWQWALQLESGVVAVNQMVRSDPRLPFGGIKQSGLGRELGQQGIREFVNTKTVFM